MIYKGGSEGLPNNFGSASKYNIFILENINLRNTYVEGRVAVGGNATFLNVGVGAGIRPLPPYGTDNSLVIGGDINIIGGRNYSGNTVRNTGSTVLNNTMGRVNGAFIIGTPIYFDTKGEYLKYASIFWSRLSSNGDCNVNLGDLTLNGDDPCLNIFQINANKIAESDLELKQLDSINIEAPPGSTILINVTGINIAFRSCQILRNGIAATRMDARTIIWNFHQASEWTNKTTAIYGSVLAPFARAKAIFSEINGNIIFKSLSGNAKIHNELFMGTLPKALSPKDNLTIARSTISSTTSNSSPTIKDALMDIVESIALEKVGLDHIINAEVEKIEKSLDLAEDINKLSEIKDSVKETLVKVMKIQMLLEFKIEEVKKIIDKK